MMLRKKLDPASAQDDELDDLPVSGNKDNNKDKTVIYGRTAASKRRAIVKKASTKLTFTEEQLIKQYYEHSVRLKNKLGIEFHVDHIVPLSIGGLHHPSNLQVVPARWNKRKHNRNTKLWLPNGL